MDCVCRCVNLRDSNVISAVLSVRRLEISPPAAAVLRIRNYVGKLRNSTKRFRKSVPFSDCLFLIKKVCRKFWYIFEIISK
jgi:hypothetical protein